MCSVIEKTKTALKREKSAVFNGYFCNLMV